MFPLFFKGRSSREMLWPKRLGRWTSWAAWSIWTLSMSLLVMNMILLLSMRERADPNAWSAFLIGLAFPTLGVLVAWRRPENAIGWLVSTLGMTLAILSTSKAYALFVLSAAPVPLPGGVAMAWLSGWLFWIIIAILGFIILLFPTGQFLSPRWRLLAWIIIADSLALICFSLSLPGDLYGFPRIPNPLELRGVLGNLISLGFVITLGIALACLFVAASSLFFRYRQAKQEERHQIKWVVSALVVNVALLSIDPLIPPGFWGNNIDGLGALLLTLAFGIAILRYHLWDIDILISRTLVYGTLTASVIGIYVLVVGYLGVLFRTSGNLLISLIATGCVAVLFQPLRGWLQRGVNRLLYGQRDEPYTVITRMSQRLEVALAPDAILPTIVETVASALKLPAAVIELAREDTFEPVASYGKPGGEMLMLPLSYQGETIGQLRLAPRTPGEAFTPADQRLLDELARHAGLAAHAVRLTTDLQRSRERIVTAREEERRRLRRDLHDGLGATLAALHLQAGAVRTLMRHDLDAAEAEILDLQTEIRAAVTDIRRLVYALRPPTLDELGLVEAIRQHAAQHETPGMTEGRSGAREDSLRIVIEAPEQLPAVPAAVEVAAYRIVQEALTNVVRHAHARTCTVRLAFADMFQIEVVDDGVGLPAVYRSGVGLISLHERAAELGGSCVVEPAPGRGTRVLARLPLPKE
jgi:signal transduction histidine kinase